MSSSQMIASTTMRVSITADVDVPTGTHLTDDDILWCALAQLSKPYARLLYGVVIDREED